MNVSPTYADKRQRYFAGARKRFINDLPDNREARMLEIGCGNGDTGAYALATGKCGWCCGVELCEKPALEARSKLDQVIIGNIETLDLPFAERSVDLLILSEVIEHLVDPWKTMSRLQTFMKPGGIVMAGSPNVCHFSVLFTLLKGRWRYDEKGVFDATHLRWFSPATYTELFESAGFQVEFARAAGPIGKKGVLGNILTLGMMPYLFHEQIYLRGRAAEIK